MPALVVKRFILPSLASQEIMMFNALLAAARSSMRAYLAICLSKNVGIRADGALFSTAKSFKSPSSHKPEIVDQSYLQRAFEKIASRNLWFFSARNLV